MNPALRLALIDVFGDDPEGSERICKLLIKLLAISDEHERPVAPETAQHLLGEHGHRQALAATLRVPEYPETTLLRRDLFDGFDRSVHSEHLMVFGEHLAQPAARILEH